MDTSFFLRYLAEWALAAFVIYRVLAFFIRQHTLPVMLCLLLVALFYLMHGPERLAARPEGPVIYAVASLGALAAICFQPELYWLFRGRIRQNPERSFLERGGPLDEIVKACRILSSSRTGALLAVRRADDLKAYIDKSVVIDAKVRHELLLTIFTPPTYLHDGGVIVADNRIVSCSAIFPLTQSPHLKKDLGTRHRAALGLSEETDALCIVVSEESGSVSLADRGRLYYDLPLEGLRVSIEKLLRFKKLPVPVEN